MGQPGPYHVRGIELMHECAILEVRRAGVDERGYNVPFRKYDEIVNLADESGRPLPTPAEEQSATRGEVYRLACLEVRGGNRAAVYEVELPGLDAWVSCRPLH